MNAYELYNHVFDSANAYSRETVAYVKEYAENVFGITITNETATLILECRAAWKAANDENGQWQNNNGKWQNNYYYHVRKPLENIEL